MMDATTNQLILAGEIMEAPQFDHEVFGEAFFRTVLSVALRQHGDSAEARAFFDLRLEQIPAAWLSSLQQALRHGDDRKAHTEQLKLQALAAVKAAWQGVQEE